MTIKIFITVTDKGIVQGLDWTRNQTMMDRQNFKFLGGVEAW
jgi:hypothetical protein